MSSIVLDGMTWAHRRAVDPLIATLPAFTAARSDITVRWSSRSLHGFEFAPIEDLAALYDLIILDHPFCGDIAATGCLLALDPLVDDSMRRAFVGPSLESYRYGGKIWALPVDAACQVAVARPDLLARIDSQAPRFLRATLLVVAAFFQLFDGIQVVATGILRGLGDTRSPMLWNLVGHWMLGLPVGYGLCFGGGRGITGLWIGLCVGLIAVGVVLLLIWTRRVRGFRAGVPGG